MGTLVNVILATICWLGIFKPALIQPLFNRPVREVVQTLTGTDVVLWLVTAAVISVIMAVFDHYMARRTSAGNTRLWP